MSESCKTCDEPVADVNGTLVHIGGGTMTQRCNHCGWKGGQIGRFSQCPRCSDQTSLVDDHAAL